MAARHGEVWITVRAEVSFDSSVIELDHHNPGSAVHAAVDAVTDALQGMGVSINRIGGSGHGCSDFGATEPWTASDQVNSGAHWPSEQTLRRRKHEAA